MRQGWWNWSVEDSLLICLDRFCIWAWISSSLWWMMSISICMMRHCHVYTSFSSRSSSWRTLPPSARKPICNHTTTALERVQKDAEGHSPKCYRKTMPTVKNESINLISRQQLWQAEFRKEKIKIHKRLLKNASKSTIVLLLGVFPARRPVWHPWAWLDRGKTDNYLSWFLYSNRLSAVRTKELMLKICTLFCFILVDVNTTDQKLWYAVAFNQPVNDYRPRARPRDVDASLYWSSSLIRRTFPSSSLWVGMITTALQNIYLFKWPLTVSSGMLLLSARKHWSKTQICLQTGWLPKSRHAC